MELGERVQVGWVVCRGPGLLVIRVFFFKATSIFFVLTHVCGDLFLDFCFAGDDIIRDRLRPSRWFSVMRDTVRRTGKGKQEEKLILLQNNSGWRI
jgi:hypothetical protein